MPIEATKWAIAAGLSGLLALVFLAVLPRAEGLTDALLILLLVVFFGAFAFAFGREARKAFGHAVAPPARDEGLEAALSFGMRAPLERIAGAVVGLAAPGARVEIAVTPFRPQGGSTLYRWTLRAEPPEALHAKTSLELRAAIDALAAHCETMGPVPAGTITVRLGPAGVDGFAFDAS